MYSEYTAAKNFADDQLGVILSNICDKTEALLQRRKALQRSGNNIKEHEIININAGGSIFKVRRDTLTIVKGSRLQVLFNGKLESKLLRDDSDCIFFDVDPYHFEMILERLFVLKLLNEQKDDHDHGTTQDIAPKLEPDEQAIFEIYWSFFTNQAEEQEEESEREETLEEEVFSETDGGVASASRGNTQVLLDCVKRELEELRALEEEVNLMEQKRLHVDRESFIAFFTANNNNIIKDASVSSEIMKLYLFNGETISVKQSTLLLSEDSKLTAKFSNDDWLGEHTFEHDDGAQAILVEQPAAMFKAMVNQLRLKAIPISRLKMSHIAFTPSADAKMFERVLHNQSQDNAKPLKNNNNFIYSDIITTEVDSVQMMEWLDSVGRTEKPKLLYRGSDDGWETSNFHGKCDNKGGTITVLKTKEGYVFGGYADKSWSSSTPGWVSSEKAFLFSLKCHAGLGAIKMNFKSGMEKHAIHSHSLHGPTFGGGHDIWIGYNNNMKTGHTNLGHTYELPNGCSNTFLTGKHGANSLEIEEVEVFQV